MNKQIDYRPAQKPWSRFEKASCMLVIIITLTIVLQVASKFLRYLYD
jgi:hypothetical protein